MAAVVGFVYAGRAKGIFCQEALASSTTHKPMPDLVDDGTWREAALARMSDVFVTNRGLRPMYRLMASAHRYAIDYIEQAPVIVLAAARGNGFVSSTERAFIQEQFRSMRQRKARLRDVMQAYGLPLPLPQLDGGVLTASRATAVRRLAMMNPPHCRPPRPRRPLTFPTCRRVLEQKRSAAARSQMSPQAELAMYIKRDTGLDIDREVIRKFIEGRFTTISILAHEIWHSTLEPGHPL